MAFIVAAMQIHIQLVFYLFTELNFAFVKNNASTEAAVCGHTIDQEIEMYLNSIARN